MVKKKSFDEKYTFLYTPHFPSRVKSKGEYKVLLGIGGNIGDTLRRFEHLFWYFKRSKFVHVVESSPIFKNPAFGYEAQADFYNAVVLIETKLMPRALLRYVLRVEKLFGRKRSFKDAPRTLDIDILFYEDIVMDTKVLTLPHPAWKRRSSVLIPLAAMKNRI
ncbi:MAG: 2-amino-4-hydroxy-6-hydroxymethyldihydropteridine diphosphokinase [Sulfurovum sp.]|nr:2-amino-4-hydroxy-6-hydroxymethyldihydropteridine diphosphokinase [Sulfurovum sp.]